MGAKKNGLKGPQRKTVDSMCRARSPDDFYSRHEHPEINLSDHFGLKTMTLNPVSIYPLENGGVELICTICGMKQRFADDSLF